MGRTAKLVFDEREILLDRSPDHVALIRVPTDADVSMVGGVHDLLDQGHFARSLAVNLEPNLLPVTLAELAALAQRRSDLLGRSAAVLALDQVVRSHLDARSAAI